MIEDLLSHLSDVQSMWDGFPITYRAAGCLVLGIGLIWKATDQNAREKPTFFITGMLGLAMLALAAKQFAESVK
jgi:hypothetical protein